VVILRNKGGKKACFWELIDWAGFFYIVNVLFFVLRHGYAWDTIYGFSSSSSSASSFFSVSVCLSLKEMDEREREREENKMGKGMDGWKEERKAGEIPP